MREAYRDLRKTILNVPEPSEGIPVELSAMEAGSATEEKAERVGSFGWLISCDAAFIKPASEGEALAPYCVPAPAESTGFTRCEYSH